MTLRCGAGSRTSIISYINDIFITMVDFNMLPDGSVPPEDKVEMDAMSSRVTSV